MSEQPEGQGLVLGIDTSTDVRVGVALDGRVLARATVTESRQHAEQLMPRIVAAVGEASVELAQLNLVAVGLGPGPFTGLRVGIATAQVLAYALGVGLHGVCSLDVVAAQWCDADQPPTEEFVIASDARRQELYWARYSATGVRLDGPHVSRPTELPDLPIAGPGAGLCPDSHRQPSAASPKSLDAGRLAALGLLLPDVGKEPLYLRRPDAAAPTRPKSTLPRATLPRPTLLRPALPRSGPTRRSREPVGERAERPPQKPGNSR